MRLGLGILSLETFSQDPKMHGKNVHRTPRKRAAAHLWKWWSFLKMVSLAKRCLTLELEGTGRSSFISFETSVNSLWRGCVIDLTHGTFLFLSDPTKGKNAFTRILVLSSRHGRKITFMLSYVPDIRFGCQIIFYDSTRHVAAAGQGRSQDLSQGGGEEANKILGTRGEHPENPSANSILKSRRDPAPLAMLRTLESTDRWYWWPCNTESGLPAV